MRFRITQLIKRWIGRISSLRANDVTLFRTFLIFLAITLLSYQIVDLFYKIINLTLAREIGGISRNVASAAITSNRKQEGPEDYGIIIERNLFQTTLKAVQANKADIEPLEFDNHAANFDLKGTVVGDSSLGYIFIEEHNSKKQKFYRLGDMIGASKLIKITRNMATLRSGEREIILKVKAAAKDQPLSPSRFKNITMDEKTVNKNLYNLNALMKGAVMRPFIHKGVQEGFIISKIVPNSLYEKMGLQNGDILIDINDKKINATSLMQAVNFMRHGNRIALNIKRKERSETINYSFE